MLAADSHLQIRPRLATAFRGHLHQLSYALLIQSRKWVLLENALFQVGGQDLVHVVARETKGSLREIVGAE